MGERCVVLGKSGGRNGGASYSGGDRRWRFLWREGDRKLWWGSKWRVSVGEGRLRIVLEGLGDVGDEG